MQKLETDKNDFVEFIDLEEQTLRACPTPGLTPDLHEVLWLALFQGI